MIKPSSYRLRDEHLTYLVRQFLSPATEVKFQSQGRIGWYIQYPKFSAFIGKERSDALNRIIILRETFHDSRV